MVELLLKLSHKNEEEDLKRLKHLKKLNKKNKNTENIIEIITKKEVIEILNMLKDIGLDLILGLKDMLKKIKKDLNKNEMKCLKNQNYTMNSLLN